MSRHIGFYLLTPALSFYLGSMFHLTDVSIDIINENEVSEGAIIFCYACVLIIIPISLYVISIGNYYAPLFKSKVHILYLFVPVIVLFFICFLSALLF